MREFIDDVNRPSANSSVARADRVQEDNIAQPPADGTTPAMRSLRQRYLKDLCCRISSVTSAIKQFDENDDQLLGAFIRDIQAVQNSYEKDVESLQRATGSMDTARPGLESQRGYDGAPCSLESQQTQAAPFDNEHSHVIDLGPPSDTDDDEGMVESSTVSKTGIRFGQGQISQVIDLGPPSDSDSEAEGVLPCTGGSCGQELLLATCGYH